MTPFENFFAGEFQARLDLVPDERGLFSSSDSIREASWDRKAAFLLWDALGRPERDRIAWLLRNERDPLDDLLG